MKNKKVKKKLLYQKNNIKVSQFPFKIIYISNRKALAHSKYVQTRLKTKYISNSKCKAKEGVCQKDNAQLCEDLHGMQWRIMGIVRQECLGIQLVFISIRMIHQCQQCKKLGKDLKTNTSDKTNATILISGNFILGIFFLLITYG